MQILDFVVASCQATLFTPETALSSGRVVSRLLPKWIERFDGNPTVLPIPDMVPRDVPKVILQSVSGAWSSEIADGRINIHWRHQNNDADALDFTRFVDVVPATSSGLSRVLSNPG